MDQQPEMPNTTPLPPIPPTPSIQPQPATTSIKKQDGGGAGPVIGIVVIALIIILGGAYYLLEIAPVVQQESLPSLEEARTSTDPDVQAAFSQGTSDEIGDIGADLESTNFSSIDTELSGIDTAQ